MSGARKIYCCSCRAVVYARLTHGGEIYPKHTGLHHLPFYVCDTCRNYVGCHYKTNNPTRPLGCIPTRELRELRKKIHAILDPLWKSGDMRRKEIYAEISKLNGKAFHAAELRDISLGQKILVRLEELRSKSPVLTGEVSQTTDSTKDLGDS